MTENEMRGVNTILEGALCAAELRRRASDEVKYSARRR
jgi:hypothetical protein